MTKDTDSWLVAKNDLDGTWVDNASNQLDVTVTPTMWNILRRVSLLEEIAVPTSPLRSPL